MLMLNRLKQELNHLKNPKQAHTLRRFFKTGPGEYGAGDKFLGITVPAQRKIAKKYADLGFEDLQTLLNSNIHEHRLAALLILVGQYERIQAADMQNFARSRRKIFDFYLNNTSRVNNWDLVDLSAPKIVGDFILQMNSYADGRQYLYKLARSNNLWERRIAIVSTFAFIKQGRLDETMELAKLLMRDQHDLIHKAMGWMLREAGKRDQSALIKFLDRHAHNMPRVMLRYSIEKFSPARRRYYLNRLAN